MSFGGLIQTISGRNELAKAELGELFQFTEVLLGDGQYQGSFLTKTSLEHEIMRLSISSIKRKEAEVILECDFDSKSAQQAFYFREIGIVGNGKLCYYDNAGAEAEYIDPESSAIVKQKRLRFVLAISSDVELNVTLAEGLYALDQDLRQVEAKIPAAVRVRGAAEQEFRTGDVILSAENVGAAAQSLVGAEQRFGRTNINYSWIDQDGNKGMMVGANSLTEALEDATDKMANGVESVRNMIPAAVQVKGNAETQYRTGNVNLTPENIGLGNVPNVSTNNQTPTFTQASGRANISSGERLSVIFGKIMKWFSDLKTVAFSGKYTDLTDKPTIPAAVRVKGNAESAYRTGDVNLTAANIGAVNKSGDTMSGELIPSGGVKYVGRDNYIVYPNDGNLDTPNASTNNLGFLRVTLPVSWTTTMLKFVVTIYDYLAGETTDYHISGYNYGGGSTWVCCTATCVGKAGAYHSNLPVSFGHDGNKCAITIGNANTSWHYPIVKVHDILLGRFETDFSKWKTGWTVSVDTNPLPTVNVTINNTHVAYGVISSSCTGNAASATKATQDGNGNVIANTYLPMSGGTITGNLRLKGSGNYGNMLNFGDGDYVHISEPTDDHLEIKGSYINFVTTATGTGRFTLNGKDILSIDKIYPVGSIYMSVNSTNPSTLFGGTWVRWGNGRVPISMNESETEFNTVEKVGGEKSHVITTAEMPSHTHSVKAQSATTSTNGKHTHSGHANQDIASGTSSKNRIVKGGDNTVSGFLLENGDHSHTVTIPASTTGSTGSGVGHNNLPPYITCYMWKRTA